MANIFKRSATQKLEKTLADLREREAALSLKRANAQTLFDEAVTERQEFLLSGDLADDTKVGKLQSRVDGTASQIAGIDDALETLRQQIDDIESKLLAERESAERAEASRKLAQQVAALEAAMPAWLEASRRPHAALMAVDARTFEIDELAQFLLGTCMSQIEVAAAFALDELKRTVAAVRAGHAPVPRAAGEVVQLPQPSGPTPTSQGEETELCFAVRPIKFRDLNGQQRVVLRWSDVELPKRLVARATQRGAIVAITDERRATHRGILNGLTTTPDHAFHQFGRIRG